MLYITQNYQFTINLCYSKQSNKKNENKSKPTNKHNDFLSLIQFNYYHVNIDQKVY